MPEAFANKPGQDPLENLLSVDFTTLTGVIRDILARLKDLDQLPGVLSELKELKEKQESHATELGKHSTELGNHSEHLAIHTDNLASHGTRLAGNSESIVSIKEREGATDTRLDALTEHGDELMERMVQVERSAAESKAELQNHMQVQAQTHETFTRHMKQLY
jgi:chromosome segregation ATPase